MAPRLKKKTSHGDHDDIISDSVSELSDSSSIVSSSRSSTFRFGGKFGKKKRSTDGASVGSLSRKSKATSRTGAGSKGKSAARPSAQLPPSRGGAARSKAVDLEKTGSVESGNTARTTKSSQVADKKRLVKDAKSRYNIGLVYLKTGDYAKAQDNLEHSLYCHIQLSGHDSKVYTNDTLVAIAGVREKLGDCYLANTANVDKFLALDHYEESRKLLKSIAPEDAPDNVTEMLERVEEKLKSPELRNTTRQAPASRQSNKYQMEGNRKAKTVLGVGAGAGAAAGVGAAAAVGATKPKTPSKQRLTAQGSHGKKNPNKVTANLQKVDVLGIGKGFQNFAEFVHDVGEEIADGIKDVFDDSSDDDASRKSYLSEESDWFDSAMAHLERDNHRTALNYLTSLQDKGSMKNSNFRVQMADSMMKVASGAMEAGKVSVATDAYEEALGVLKSDESAGEKSEREEKIKLASRGCIKGHKKLAVEMESVRDYGSAIQHRNRVYQLLDEDDRVVAACQQKIRIAYLHGSKDDYAKSAVELTDAIRRLFRGVKSPDMLPDDRRDVLILCYKSRTICYAKQKKWGEALQEYDDLLPLIAKKEGQGGNDYNTSLIHKSALLVTMGNHRLAASTINKYIQLSDLSTHMAGNLIVGAMDHVLALDTYAATQLKLDNVDTALNAFEGKLKFVKTLPNNDAMISDTMHKIGCLLATKNEQKKALPYLNEALIKKKFVYDGKHKSVLETTWAVAATNHTLGDNEKALKEYSVLLEKMKNVNEIPVDKIMVHNSAGQLFFEDGNVEKAIHSFREALKGAEISGDELLIAEIKLNLANALSARGEADKAMKLYTSLVQTKALKKTKIFFLTRFNKSLLLIKMGEVEEAKVILNKIVESRSSQAHDVKGSIYLALGNLAISEGNIDEALGHFEESLDLAEDDDLYAIGQAKKSIGMAYFASGKTDRAISVFEDVLEDLSSSGVEGKSVNLLQAEIWNCMSRVHKKQDDLPEAKHYSKLALQTYKTELGETNPITLRNVSNLQLLLLEEAEGLQKSEAKSVIDAAKYELEDTLDAFLTLNDPWTYRLDVASLQTNLAFVAIWQGKPKKARKLLRQIQEIELPPEHPLEHRVEVLEESVEKLEEKKRSK